jgi:hypothetical protein
MPTARNSTMARVSGSQKKLMLLLPCQWRGIVAELDGCIELWRVQYIGVGRPRGWRLLGGNHRAAAPGALAPKTAPMGRA